MAEIEVRIADYGLDCRWTTTTNHSLRFTSTGNLELWNTADDRLIWETQTNDGGAALLSMQHDGNLVIYDEQKKSLWASNTAPNPGAFLAVQGDGNVVIYTTDGRPIWQTGTEGK